LGSQALTEDELVGLVLTGGIGGRVPAQSLLTRLGGLAGVARATLAELRGEGVGEARAAGLCAALELGRRVAQAEVSSRPVLQSAKAAYAFLKPRMAHLSHEVFSVTLLDLRLRVLRELPVASGTGWACAVHPRDVLAPAVRERASAVIFAHNHPSGETSPSTEDRLLTARLVAACELLGLRAVDHLVIGNEGYSSFRELGLWP
jgi:DNA repair protein RadC